MKFTQAQALAMYKQLKAIEVWLEYNANLVASDCEEADKLKEVRDTFNEAHIVHSRQTQ